MANRESVVAIFHTPSEAEQAVKDLHHAGVDMHSVSIVVRDYTTGEQAVGYYNAGERMPRWGNTAAFWGLLFGSAFFAIPGVGTLLVAGPLAAGIFGTLDKPISAGGIGALGAALVSIGIPKANASEYELAVADDMVLLTVSASAATRAREILAATKAIRVTLHGPKVFAAAS